MRSIYSAALAVALLATSAAAQHATVTDGDTIKVADTIYRLWGIDAAESKQLCADGWPAGRAATTYHARPGEGPHGHLRG